MKKAIPIIVIVILILIIFVPFLKEWSSSPNLPWNQKTTGMCGVQVDITYLDGTQETISPTFTILPLNVYFGDNPKPLKSIRFAVIAKFDYQKQIQTISVDGNITFDFTMDGTPEKTNKEPRTLNGPSNSSGTLQLRICALELTEAELNRFASNIEGEYNSCITGTGRLTITYSDGTTETLKNDGVIEKVTFKITDETTSTLKLEITSKPFYYE